MGTTATDFGLQLKKYRIGFGGVTASNTPVILRLCSSTGATNSTPGTGNTSGTAGILQAAGRTIATTNMVGFYNSTAEPTVKTPIDELSVTPNGGTIIYDFPLGDEPDIFLSGNSWFLLDMTTPSQTVGVIATLWFTRI